MRDAAATQAEEKTLVPIGYDACAVERFGHLNRMISGAVLTGFVACAGVLVHSEVLSARLTQQGWQLLYDDDVGTAVAPLRRAARLKRTNTKAVYGLWQALFLLGRYEEAIDVGRRHVMLNRTQGEANIEIALTIMKAGPTGPETCAKALPYLMWANRFSPWDFVALEALSECYEQIGDLEQAARTNMELARTYARHWDLWEGQLEKKGTSDRALVVAYNGIAWICATSRIRAFRDPEKALSYARKAVELAGEDEGRAPVLDTLAEAYFANGDVGRAVYTIQVAIDVLQRQSRQKNVYYYILQKRKFLDAWRGMAA